MDRLERVVVAYFVVAAAFWFVVGVVVSAQGYPAVWVFAAPLAAIFAWGARLIATE